MPRSYIGQRLFGWYPGLTLPAGSNASFPDNNQRWSTRQIEASVQGQPALTASQCNCRCGAVGVCVGYVWLANNATCWLFNTMQPVTPAPDPDPRTVMGRVVTGASPPLASRTQRRRQCCAARVDASRERPAPVLFSGGRERRGGRQETAHACLACSRCPRASRRLASPRLGQRGKARRLRAREGAARPLALRQSDPPTTSHCVAARAGAAIPSCSSPPWFWTNTGTAVGTSDRITYYQNMPVNVSYAQCYASCTMDPACQVRPMLS